MKVWINFVSIYILSIKDSLTSPFLYSVQCRSYFRPIFCTTERWLAKLDQSASGQWGKRWKCPRIDLRICDPSMWIRTSFYSSSRWNQEQRTSTELWKMFSRFIGHPKFIHFTVLAKKFQVVRNISGRKRKLPSVALRSCTVESPLKRLPQN